MATAGIELVQHLPPLAAANPELIHDLLEFHRLFGREARPSSPPCAPSLPTSTRLRNLATRADAAATIAELFDLDFAFYGGYARISRNRIVVLLVNTVREGIRGFMPVLVDLEGPLRRHHRGSIAAIEVPGASPARTRGLAAHGHPGRRRSNRAARAAPPRARREIDRMQHDLAAILDHFAALAEVDTAGVEPMTHAVPVELVLRADVAAPSLAVGDVTRGRRRFAMTCSWCRRSSRERADARRRRDRAPRGGR